MLKPVIIPIRVRRRFRLGFMVCNCCKVGFTGPFRPKMTRALGCGPPRVSPSHRLRGEGIVVTALSEIGSPGLHIETKRRFVLRFSIHNRHTRVRQFGRAGVSSTPLSDGASLLQMRPAPIQFLVCCDRQNAGCVSQHFCRSGLRVGGPSSVLARESSRAPHSADRAAHLRAGNPLPKLGILAFNVG
jgi:hypothetical protein